MAHRYHFSSEASSWLHDQDALIYSTETTQRSCLSRDSQNASLARNSCSRRELQRHLEQEPAKLPKDMSLLPVWSGVMLEHIIPGFGNMFQCQKMHYQPQHSHWAKRSRPESAPLEPYWHWQKAGTTQSRSRLYQKPLLEPSEIHDGQSHLWTRPYRRQIAWSTRSVQSSRVENRCPLTI